MGVRFKEFDMEPASEGGGGFVGYAATFDREPDSYGDVIAPKAFDRTVAAWKESGNPVPLLYGHNMADPDYNIGTAELEVDERGLKVTAAFDESPKAQRVRELVKAGRVRKMSFAYDVLESGEVTLETGVKANELRDVELYEVSAVLVPANSHAEIVEAKSMRKYGATISKATGDELSAAIDAAEECMDALDAAASGIDAASKAVASVIETLSALVGDRDEDGAGEGEGDEEPPEGEGQGNGAKSRLVAARLGTLISE